MTRNQSWMWVLLSIVALLSINQVRQELKLSKLSAVTVEPVVKKVDRQPARPVAYDDMPILRQSGRFVPGVERLINKSILTAGKPSVGSPSWLGQAYSMTLYAPNNAVGVSLLSGAYICLNGASRCFRWNGSAIDFGAAPVTLSTTYTSTATSGNGFAVSTGGRYDFGGGASDHASSDGTTVTFAGPIASSSTVNGTNITASNALTATGTISGGAGKFVVATTGKVTLDATDSSGTPGAVTINKPSGQVSIAAAASNITVTNSLVSTSSIVHVVVQQGDASCRNIRTVIPAAGSFVIQMDAACTAATKFGFVVFN